MNHNQLCSFVPHEPILHIQIEFEVVGTFEIIKTHTQNLKTDIIRWKEQSCPLNASLSSYREPDSLFITGQG